MYGIASSVSYSINPMSVSAAQWAIPLNRPQCMTGWRVSPA